MIVFDMRCIGGTHGLFAHGCTLRRICTHGLSISQGKSGNKFPTKKFCISVFINVSTDTQQKNPLGAVKVRVPMTLFEKLSKATVNIVSQAKMTQYWGTFKYLFNQQMCGYGCGCGRDLCFCPYKEIYLGQISS